MQREDSNEPDPNAWVLALEQGKPAHFSTRFGHRPRIVGLVRRFVADFHDEIVLGDTTHESGPSPWASQLSMAAHELVENALSYGAAGGANFSVTIDPDPDDPNVYAVRMKTRNRADPGQHEVVRRMLHDLNEAEDPFTFYLGLMTATAQREEGSGLGLARVRVEAEMEITCVLEGDELEVVAQARILRNRGADA